MPNIPWSQQVLCTPADVRQRLKSPEVPLVLNQDNSTPIAFTVDTATNIFTTAVPHGYLANQSVGFANSGGALPSPLVSGTTYYVLSRTPTTFWVSTVVGGDPLDITTAGTGQNSVTSNAVDLVIQSEINLTKDWMRQDILTEMKKRYPELVQTWFLYKNTLLVQTIQRIHRNLQLIGQSAGLPNAGMMGIDGAVFDLFYYLQYWPVTKPQFYTMYGPPTNGVNGSYAASAQTGDILIDTWHWQPYINRGSLNNTTNVQWQLSKATDCLDNILNAYELKHAAVDCCIWAMFQNGTLRNRVDYQNVNTAAFYMDNEAKWEKSYRKRISDVIYLLEIDIDGDGVMSDFERGLTTPEIVLFGA